MDRLIQRKTSYLALSLSLAAILSITGSASGAPHSANFGTSNTICPLCPAIGAQTIGEGLTSMDVAVFAKLVERSGDSSDGQAKATFEIQEVLFGEPALKGERSIEFDYYGAQEIGTEFLIAAIDPLNLTWNDPIVMSERGKKYVREVSDLPSTMKERLLFFLSNLEDEDQVIASDAYDEFARAPYVDVLSIADHYDRAQLLEWIQSDDVPTARVRLYFMLLGICGQADDAKTLEEMIRHSLTEKRPGLDSMIACYLSLAGPDGMELIDRELMANADAGYSQTYAAIMALRFHGTDADAIPRERIVDSFQLLLDRPNIADLVIPDLARWEAWDSADDLMTLFREATPENQFVRVPIVIYMRLCPKSEAKEYLSEIERIDPGAVKKADLTYAFGNGQ